MLSEHQEELIKLAILHGVSFSFEVMVISKEVHVTVCWNVGYSGGFVESELIEEDELDEFPVGSDGFRSLISNIQDRLSRYALDRIAKGPDDEVD